MNEDHETSGVGSSDQPGINLVRVTFLDGGTPAPHPAGDFARCKSQLHASDYEASIASGLAIGFDGEAFSGRSSCGTGHAEPQNGSASCVRLWVPCR